MDEAITTMTNIRYRDMFVEVISCIFYYWTSADSLTPSVVESAVNSGGEIVSEADVLIQVEENAMEDSWKEVLSDNDDTLVSELNKLELLSIASLRFLSLAATTVLGVLAVSVSLLDVLPARSVWLLSAVPSLSISTYSSASSWTEEGLWCDSPEHKSRQYWQ